MIDVRSKPVWQLTSADLDALDHQERQWAISHIGYLEETGALAVLSANPRGTTYETVWDANGGWKLQPVCCCDRSTIAQRDFVAVYSELSLSPRSGGTER